MLVRLFVKCVSLLEGLKSKIMETTVEIRKRIRDYVDQADERILRIFNAIITSEEETKHLVPESFYQELDKDREMHLKGETPSYTWEEVKSRLVKKHGL